MQKLHSILLLSLVAISSAVLLSSCQGGASGSTGWSYNAVDNSIDFEDDYVPEGGSTIEVDYALQGDCDA